MFARTERLLLRPGWREDAPALHRAIADEEVVRNLAAVPWPYRLADAEAYLSKQRKPWESLLIFRRTDAEPELVGAIGFGPRPSGDVELGFWIARPHWNRGYATEAGRAVVHAARHSLRLPKLKAGHFLDNPASGRVLEKLGFRPVGNVALRPSLARGRETPARMFELQLADEAAPTAMAA